MKVTLLETGRFYQQLGFEYGFFLRNDGEILVEPHMKYETFSGSIWDFSDLPDSIQDIVKCFGMYEIVEKS